MSKCLHELVSMFQNRVGLGIFRSPKINFIPPPFHDYQLLMDLNQIRFEGNRGSPVAFLKKIMFEATVFFNAIK